MHCVTIPEPVNPALRPALDALAAILTDYHYAARAASAIVAYVAAEGTTAGAPGLDPEDDPVAEMTYVDALPAVPFASAEWDSPDLAATAVEPPADWKGEAPDEGWHHPHHGTLIPPELEDLDAALPPICGGGFEPDEADRAWAAEAFAEPGPVTPSPADWRDYHAHLDSIEPRYGYE